MALVKLSNGIVSIHGRFGGVYFKHDNSGQHIQAMPRVVRYTRHEELVHHSPRTGASQAAHIRSFSVGANLWQIVALTFGVLFYVFAATYYYVSKKGRVVKLTGWNWFVHFNVGREVRGYNDYWKPPPSDTVRPDMVILSDFATVWTDSPFPFPPGDCTGYYYKTGTYDGNDYYKSDDNLWYVWRDGPWWYVTPELGVIGAGPWFRRGHPDPIGNYTDAEDPPRSAEATP